MAENRFFLDAHFLKGSDHLLIGEEHHHLSKVMRNEVGDTVELVNGKNQLAIAKITRLEKRETHLHLENVTEKKPSTSLILAQGLTRPKNLDLIIEKGTELGATAFYLFPAERSEKKELSDNQKIRLKTLSISAMKQCGRLDLPTIELMPPLKEWEPLKGRLLFGDLSPNAPPLTSSPEEATIFIGPEKGLSPSEIDLLQNTLNAKGIRLSRNILRAETAAICSLSLLATYD